MQHLRGAGWIKARTLPQSVRTVKSLLQKGWIEKQYQGPNNEVFLRLTEKGLEAKKTVVVCRRLGPRCLARARHLYGAEATGFDCGS